MSSSDRLIRYIKKGRNVLRYGSGGTGKTHDIKTAYNALTRMGKTCELTASTGCAACGIRGVTIHRFFGIGIGKKPLKIILQTMKSPVFNRIRECDVLFMEEISMVGRKTFEL